MRARSAVRAALLAGGIVVSACSPYPVYVVEAPTPLVSDPRHQTECAMIRTEIAQQLRTAELSGIMASALVEASVRLNVANVIAGLETRAAIEGCPV
jgi:hypothetical protein